ncbi:ribonuclease E inhibitor RraB [Microbulbifer hainanensis]|uniref:ribonuclease E inhibitor RraB n=1 Tax=Microbulbifer hainanensis TaxID=2735675 RepID=UPI00186775B8|nr:ribonuclease E inhibitor RraB [Microbulbifer hainanensis]
MEWPNDADGDVLRRLKERNFNFASEHEVDFNIDFDHWPLTEAERMYLFQNYPGAEFIEPDEEDLVNGNTCGYVLIKFKSKISYEFVVETQKFITRKTSFIGGSCESWGLWGG